MDTGQYLIMASGRRVDIPNPLPGQLIIEDLATGVSRIPRFVGHTDRFFSVAQHSLVVAYLSVAVAEYQTIPTHLCGLVRHHSLKEGMAHDLHEALVSDIPLPVKRLLGPTYKDVEKSIDAAIRKELSLATTLPPHVKIADWMALILESQELRGPDKIDPSFVPHEAKRIIEDAMDGKFQSEWLELAMSVLSRSLWPEAARHLFMDEWGKIDN